MKTSSSLRSSSSFSLHQAIKRKGAVLLMAGLMCLTVTSGRAAVITLANLATNSATGGNDGTFFVGGNPSYKFATGNPADGDYEYRSLLKFDITGLAGQTVSDVSLNLSLYYAQTYPTGPTSFEIGVSAFAADKGAGTFVQADLTSSTTLLGSFQVGGATVGGYSAAGEPFSLNVTTALQAAINANYNYFSIRLNNITTDAYEAPQSPFGPAIISFANSSTDPFSLPSLQYTAVPEPTTVGMLMLGGLVVMASSHRRSLRAVGMKSARA